MDVRVALPGGPELRVRKKTPCASRSASARWGEDLQRRLHQQLVDEQVEAQTQAGGREATKVNREVPTLKEFAPRFLTGHAVANRHKPSGIAGKETILRVHLVPLFGAGKLDAITTEGVQALKSKLVDKAPKTVNNVLTVLNTLLKVAVEWGVIKRLPCVIKLVRTPRVAPRFHDFAEYERLVVAAGQMDTMTKIIVLLGGQAGLRLGEMTALEWRDLDFTQGRMCVERSDWKGHVTSPKGGRLRYIPMTQRLRAALKSSRHLRSERVLCEPDGTALTQKVMRNIVRRAARRAGVKHEGVHVLRHTFCSHLAMRGVPARAIQELAGHESLMTTQRYMHLSPAATDVAIALLDRGTTTTNFGDMLETAEAKIAKSQP